LEAELLDEAISSPRFDQYYPDRPDGQSRVPRSGSAARFATASIVKQD
jgi:hypothetical protein